MPVLQIFVEPYCITCDETRRLAAEIAQRARGVTVQLVDIDSPDAIIPPEVFATPTYVLDGHLISLGNPTLEQLRKILADAGVSIGEEVAEAER